MIILKILFGSLAAICAAIGLVMLLRQAYIPSTAFGVFALVFALVYSSAAKAGKE